MQQEYMYAQSLQELMTLQKKINDLSLWHQPQIKHHLEIISQNIQEIQEVIKQNQQPPQQQVQNGIQPHLNNLGQQHNMNNPPQSNQQIVQQNQPPKQIVLQFDKKIQSELSTAINTFNLKVIDKMILQTDNKTQENCIICIDTLFDESKNVQQIPVVQLQCTHYFHWDCIKGTIGKNSLKCPVCSSIQGKLIGDMPDGKMTVQFIRDRCSGYNCNSIKIIYDFKPGKRNGKYYDGTYREAFLPNNQEGQEILSLLQRSFDQKLTFSIGTSVTTGRDNQIVWNGIHHKTSLSGGPTNFGYPDQTYFDRVKQELKQKGIQ